MKRNVFGLIGLTLVVGLLSYAPNVLAEPFVGVYGGLAIAADSDFKDSDATVPLFDEDGAFLFSIFLAGIDRSTELDESVTFGFRAGYWFDALPMLGAAFDFYVFSPDLTIKGTEQEVNDPFLGPFTLVFPERNFDINVTTLGFSIMGRYPFMKGPDYPRGRLQPHIGIGPALFITHWDDQTGGEPLEVFEIDGDSVIINEPFNLGSNTVVNGGVQLMVGATYFILEKLAIFGEFKFTHHVAQIGGFDNLAEQTRFAGTSLVGNQSFNISHLNFGISYYFY